jgi:hypothetical protein
MKSEMSQPAPIVTNLFRNSLRSWQANYKARQAELSAAGLAPQPEPNAVPRKKAFGKKRRSRRRTARPAQA